MIRAAVRHALCAIAFAATPVAVAADRITIEDFVTAQDFDAQWCGSAFSPDGRSLAYTITAAPTERPSWGYFVAGFQTMAHVFVTTDGGPAREIVGSPDVVYSLTTTNTWSPDGSGLLLVASKRDSYALAYYDLASAKLTPLPEHVFNSFLLPFAWTPDGRIAYATAPADARQSLADNQVLRTLEQRWHATWNGEPAQVTVQSANPVFAPTAEPTGALILVDPRSGATQRIVDGNYLSIAIAPSGRYIAAVRAAEPMANALHPFGKRGELQIFSLDANGAHLLHSVADIDIAAFDKSAWSPSGKTLLVIARPRDSKTKEAHLFTLDAQSGKRRALDDTGLLFEKTPPEFGTYPVGWLGERAVAIAAHAAENAEGLSMPSFSGAGNSLEYGQGRGLRPDLFAFDGAHREVLTAFAKTSVRDFVAMEDGALAIADGALWKVTPGKAAEKLTAEGHPNVLAFGTDKRNPPPVAQSTYYRNGDVEHVALYAIADGKPARVVFDLRSKSVVPLALKGDVMVSAPDKRKVLTRINDGWASSLALTDGGSERTLATINARLKDRAVATAEHFTYKLGTRTLNGFVVWPSSAKPGVKLPAVTIVYGGVVYGEQPPSDTKPEIGPPIFSGQLLAAEGYAVIYPSTPLGAGSDTDQPAALAEAVIAAVDALAKGGRIDVNRVGVMGQSYGGFSTTAILSKRSDRFKAGVSTAGLYDFMHGYGTRPFTAVFSDDAVGLLFAKFIEDGQGQLGKPFWQASDAYIRNSPIFHVDTLNAPLLMLHGDLDLGATDLAGAERMYTALVRAGKKPVLVHYWGEGHVAQAAVSMRDQWGRVATWFGTYLKRSSK